MRLRPLVLALLAVVLLAIPLSASAAPPPVPRIAYVDMQRVMNELEEAKLAKARLQKWLEARQKEIDAQQEAIRKEKEAFDKAASTMKEEARVQKANELQQKVMEIGQRWERSRLESADRERKEMAPILTKLDEIVAGIARRDGITWVFEKREAGVLYADAAFDLTNEVIRRYNAAPAKK